MYLDLISILLIYPVGRYILQRDYYRKNIDDVEFYITMFLLVCLLIPGINLIVEISFGFIYAWQYIETEIEFDFDPFEIDDYIKVYKNILTKIFFKK